MTRDPYSQAVRAYFSSPVHTGDIEDGTDVRVDGQGVRVQLAAAHAGGRIESLRFRAWGCPHLLAACEAFCSDFEGSACTALLEFNASDLMQTLAIPVEKTGRILVLEDAVRSLGTAVSAPAGQH